MTLRPFVLHPFAPPTKAPLLLADHRGAGLVALGEELDARGFPPLFTHNRAETVAALGADAARAIVLDPGGVGGVEIDEVAMAAPDVPLLLCVDPQSPEAGLAAWEAAGAPLMDVIHRGAPAHEFALRLNALERAASWRHRASHDERTECLRPEAFEEHFTQHVSAARRHGFPVALAMLDLDRFGRINKRHDHTVGDRVIAEVGRLLKVSLRGEDLAGRVGGDEFALSLPYTTEAEARACVQRLLESLAGTSVPGHGGVDVEVSASAGFAITEGAAGPSLEELRRRAEEALRAAKRKGGGAAISWSELEPEDALAAAE